MRASFNRSLRVHGKADRTLELYSQSIDYFSAWLTTEGQAPELSAVTRNNVLGWLDSLRSRSLTDGTMRTRCVNDLRDAVIIRLLIDCGCRVSELTGIDTQNIDLDAESLTVTGKRNRTRMAYSGAKTGLTRNRYLRARRAHRHADDPASLLGERQSATQSFAPHGLSRLHVASPAEPAGFCRN